MLMVVTTNELYVFNDVNGEVPSMLFRGDGDLAGFTSRPAVFDEGDGAVIELKLRSGEKMAVRSGGLWFPERRAMQAAVDALIGG
jgi:hypothetical protein